MPCPRGSMHSRREPSSEMKDRSTCRGRRPPKSSSELNLAASVVRSDDTAVSLPDDRAIESMSYRCDPKRPRYACWERTSPSVHRLRADTLAAHRCWSVTDDPKASAKLVAIIEAIGLHDDGDPIVVDAKYDAIDRLVHRFVAGRGDDFGERHGRRREQRGRWRCRSATPRSPGRWPRRRLRYWTAR